MAKSYIVNAYRWGSHQNHSYTLGCFSNPDIAKEIAESHATYRGGKYECTVEECETDVFDNDSDRYTTEIYRTDTWGRDKN